jgi:hypothetical protein
MDIIKPYNRIFNYKGGPFKALYDMVTKGAGGKTVGEGGGYTQHQLTLAFGDPEDLPSDFFAIYTNTNSGAKYLVTVVEDEFKGVSFGNIS